MRSEVLSSRARLLLLVTGVLAAGMVYLVTRPDPAPPADPVVVMIDGIPRIDYHGEIGVQDNPWHIASWAVDDEANLLPASDWLVENQHPDGSWRYEFPHMASGKLPLAEGWPSALAQGGGIRALAAAYEETGDEQYRRAAQAALDFLERDVREGGVRTELSGDVWFEEYPTDPPSYVLNGYLYLLEGLWEARQVLPDAQRVYDEGRRTLERHIGRWDDGSGHVAYDLLHESLDAPPWWLLAYDPIHERLLRTVLEQRESPAVRDWYDRWYPDGRLPEPPP